jgi:UDP-N-acetylmuramate--alanine ligase
LFSRTRDFADEFARAYLFNEVILMDIYPARELPIKGITSEWLLDKIDNKHKEIVSKQDLIKTILETNAQVIVTIGAGDIELVVSIKEALNENI